MTSKQSPFYNALTAFTGTPAPAAKPAATVYKYVKPEYAHKHLPMLTHNDVPNTTLMRTLYRALRVKRDSGTMTEARFVAWLCNRLPVTMIDGAGNIHVDLRTQPQHRTMFTSHTDTVHHTGGDNSIRLDTSNPKRTLWRADEGACLGADDGAGVALMAHMIDKKIPGLYVFFRSEECGGIGSSWLAKNFANTVKNIDRCISLDRADQSDVITHQAGGRCCSDAFALTLADRLTTDDMTIAYTPDATGVFTDSANLTELIPECTNLSVGYKHQHGDGEYQDVTFLQALADQLCLVAWDDLPTERDPLAVEKYDKYADAYESAWFSGPYGKQTDTTKVKSHGGYGSGFTDFEEDVMDALYAAECDEFGCITGIVAEYMLPDDPETARRHIDPRRVQPVMYRTYADGIFDGEYDADAVMEILMTDLYKE